MDEQLLGVLAVWGAWTLAEHFLEGPKWLWEALAIAAGIGWQCALHLSDWWMGIGIGAGASLLYVLSDLVLVATDACKVHVLRNTRSKVNQ
jgi:hypothetical protein